MSVRGHVWPTRDHRQHRVDPPLPPFRSQVEVADDGDQRRHPRSGHRPGDDRPPRHPGLAEKLGFERSLDGPRDRPESKLLAEGKSAELSDKYGAGA